MSVNKLKSDIDETEKDESQSTAFNDLRTIKFKNNWNPIFYQKSCESDSLSQMTISRSQDKAFANQSDVMYCNSTIQNEATKFANIIENDIKNNDEKSCHTTNDLYFLEDENSHQIR